MVLPQPDGPRSATSSPGAMSIVRPSSAWTDPYQRCSPWNATATPCPVSAGARARCGHVAGSSAARLGAAVAAGREAGDDDQQDEREEQGGEANRDRDERVALAEQVDDDLERVEVSSDEIVYSPSTSAIARTDADRIPPRMFGTMTWRIVRGQPAPRLRDASASVADVDRPQARIDGAVRERQDQDDVDERERQREAPTAPRCWPIER